MTVRQFIIIFFISISANLVAQVPQKMSFQAVVRNSSGILIKNTSVGVRISIIKDSANGSAIYKEIFNPNPLTNSNGLFSLEIGGGVPITGTFSSIDWSKGPYFVKSETDPNGGTNYSIIGTSQLLSVPYALHSKTADSVKNLNTIKHYVGELFGGGIVVQVWKDSLNVEHGLIASLFDLSSAYVWSNITTDIGASAQNQMDGRINCNAIVNQAGHTQSAAKLCLDYTSGGFSDWYLPSYLELLQISQNAFLLNNVMSSNSDLIVPGFYWSSTEGTSSYGGYYILFGRWNSVSPNPVKSSQLRVRAVRRF